MPASDPAFAPAGLSRLPIFAAVAQGFFCLVLGLWPVISLASFEAVTGEPKPDHWALTIAALLLASIGASLLLSAVRRDIAVEVYVLGLAAALSLAAADIIFVIGGQIHAVHLLDAFAQILFVGLWGFAIRDLLRRRRTVPIPPDLGDMTEPKGPYASG